MSKEIQVMVSEIGMEPYMAKVSNYRHYFRLLNCITFDVVRVIWKGHNISLFVDDEGLMKPNLGRDVIYDDTSGETTPLFGTIVVTGDVDEDGETLGKPDELSMDEIMKFISEPKYQTNM